MASGDIRVDITGYDANYSSSLTETLKIAKAYGNSVSIRFTPSNIRMTVWPESCSVDLHRIYNLEIELLKIKNNEK